MKEILRISNLVKYYGSAGVVIKAVDNISFVVKEGEFVAIMGASGSGKSTLLNLISTIDRASSGTIIIDDQNISEINQKALSIFRRDKLGFIFQEYNLLDTLTIAENIALPLNLKNINAERTGGEVNRVAAALGVGDQLGKFPYELSGGQRQRAACARAIIASPSLILADEPTGALDSKNSKTLMNTFEYMNKSLKATILMVTHDASIGSYAGRVLFLKDGKIYNEILRGDRDRQAMYSEIIAVSASLGGECGC